MTRLAWPVTIRGTLAPTYGYRTLSRNLQAALERLGVDWDDDAGVALHVTPPHLFRPLEGVYNALLSMWESDALPPALAANVNRADLVLVPCRQNERAFKWSGVRKPVRVVPLGLDAAHAVPAGDGARLLAPRFRFLWVGQPDVRKGFDLVTDAFVRAFPAAVRSGPPVELLLKTNTNGAAGFEAATGRVRVIARPFSDDAMAHLYRTAHAFVFPTRGEGFGLPVLEAMAAECLVLAPAVGGLADVVSAREARMLPWGPVPGHYGVAVAVPQVPVPALMQAMQAAVLDYGMTGPLRARARARALTFTWEQTARRVLAAIEQRGARTLALA
jgi:glycosyltransferase involved in cell wall biosynthesis